MSRPTVTADLDTPGVGRASEAALLDPRGDFFYLPGAGNGIRRCPICRMVKPFAAFARDATKRSGYASRCSDCDAKRCQQYYVANRDAKLAYARQYRRAHPKAKAVRMCARCGTVPAISQRHRYCASCRDVVAREQRKVRGRSRSRGSATERGYGTRHKQERAKWEPKVAAGGVVCARADCGRLILPGEPWHLGHVDEDRTRYAGPEHVKCNCGTSKRANHRRSRAKRARHATPQR